MSSGGIGLVQDRYHVVVDEADEKTDFKFLIHLRVAKRGQQYSLQGQGGRSLLTTNRYRIETHIRITGIISVLQEQEHGTLSLMAEDEDRSVPRTGLQILVLSAHRKGALSQRLHDFCTSSGVSEPTADIQLQVLAPRRLLGIDYSCLRLAARRAQQENY